MAFFEVERKKRKLSVSVIRKAKIRKDRVVFFFGPFGERKRKRITLFSGESFLWFRKEVRKREFKRRADGGSRGKILLSLFGLTQVKRGDNPHWFDFFSFSLF